MDAVGLDIMSMKPAQRYITSERKRGVTIIALAKRWQVSRQTIHELQKTGIIRGAELLKRIHLDSGIDPRVLLGLPTICTCLLCHEKMHVSRLAFESGDNQAAIDTEDYEKACEVSERIKSGKESTILLDELKDKLE